MVHEKRIRWEHTAPQLAAIPKMEMKWMSKPVDQGTRFESRIVTRAKEVGREHARREPKTGTKHEPDVYIPGSRKRAVVAWENWKKEDGKKRRTARRMVTLTEQHFFELLANDTDAQFGYHVQCKSTQALSLRTILDGLLEWMKANGKEEK